MITFFMEMSVSRSAGKSNFGNYVRHLLCPQLSESTNERIDFDETSCGHILTIKTIHGFRDWLETDINKRCEHIAQTFSYVKY